MRIPIPVDTKEELEVNLQHRDPSFITWYINVPSWKCKKCNATMFGRMTYCVYCKLKLGIHSPRED